MDYTALPFEPRRAIVPAPPPPLLDRGVVRVVFTDNQITTLNRTVKEFPVGTSLGDIARSIPGRHIVVLDGEPVLQADWGYEVEAADYVHVISLLEGGGDGGGSNALRTILLIVVVVVAIVYAPDVAAAILDGALVSPEAVALTQAAMIAVGSALVNAALPYRPGGEGALGDQQAPSSVYSISSSGNQAKPNSPIPVPYGIHISYPDFCGQPYSEFEDHDQYYNAIMCVGLGDMDVIQSEVFIDDTRIDHFSDIEVVIGTATQCKALVDPAVVTAVEVTGQEMVPGLAIGPFTLCAGGFYGDQVSYDFVWPYGLGYFQDDGSISGLQTQWRIYIRPVDSSGSHLSDWALLAEVAHANNTKEANRITYTYDLEEGRYETYVTRVDQRNTNSRAAHQMFWSGVRFRLTNPAPLDTNGKYLAVRMRASAQLNGLSQRRFACIVRRRLITWNPTTGFSSTAVQTQNPAWALLDILRNPYYGAAMPDNRIDLQAIYELSQVFAERGDRFNFIFDTRVTVWDALALVCRGVRTARFMRGGVFTFCRDESQEIPVMLFSNRNINRNTLNINYAVSTEETPDGVEVSFFDERTWSENRFTLASAVLDGAPESTVPERPQVVSFAGITELRHIMREAYYTLATNKWRRKFISFATEMDGFIASYGDVVALSHDLPSWGAARGDVVHYDPITRVLSVNEELDFTAGGQHYVAFLSLEGDFDGPYAVSQRDSLYQMTLAEDPEKPIYVENQKERTKFTFGPSTNIHQKIKIIGLSPRSMTEIEVRAVTEDDRVHTADEVVAASPPPAPPPNPGGGIGSGLNWQGVVLGNVQMVAPGHVDTIVDLDQGTIIPGALPGHAVQFIGDYIPAPIQRLAASEGVRLGLIPRPEVDPGWNRGDYNRMWGDMAEMYCTTAETPEWRCVLHTRRGSPDPLAEYGKDWKLIGYVGDPPPLSATVTPSYQGGGTVILTVNITGAIGDWWFLINNGYAGMTVDSTEAPVNLTGQWPTLDKHVTVHFFDNEFHGGTLHFWIMDGTGRTLQGNTEWTAS